MGLLNSCGSDKTSAPGANLQEANVVVSGLELVESGDFPYAPAVGQSLSLTEDTTTQSGACTYTKKEIQKTILSRLENKLIVEEKVTLLGSNQIECNGEVQSARLYRVASVASDSQGISDLKTTIKNLVSGYKAVGPSDCQVDIMKKDDLITVLAGDNCAYKVAVGSQPGVAKKTVFNSRYF